DLDLKILEIFIEIFKTNRNLEALIAKQSSIIVSLCARLIPLSQVDQYLALAGGVRNRGWVRLFREVLTGLPACRSLSCDAAAGAGLSARLCADCRARRYPSNSSGDGARRARAWFRTRHAGRSADS